ncbi:MAG: SoxR reducing system RseC family protein [candidate division KSB1 bacterium]|nr:SoxR reducing system RseC family protein [candidate division KSB1 bacterium]MDZ7333596.1 SoxR reducing system RseC family protein [candidate division KSB1 bacterium]MDZ7357830.1 SoxR reducing system RseC family protein [candidate division KSB1 bacterium]MDZ7398710.1 SoxR reducing system RseC family protein [candidate division KSB1 bacterium]
MLENGIVMRVERDLAWVMMIKGEQCAGCTACKSFGEGRFEIVALNRLGARPGDNVEVEINPKQVVKYSAIVFLLPVFALIIGYFLGSSWLSVLGWSDEAAGIVGSLGLMILCFLGIAGYDRIISRSQQVNAYIRRVL